MSSLLSADVRLPRDEEGVAVGALLPLPEVAAEDAGLVAGAGRRGGVADAAFAARPLMRAVVDGGGGEDEFVFAGAVVVAGGVGSARR